jgi:hypothetical protein
MGILQHNEAVEKPRFGRFRDCIQQNLLLRDNYSNVISKARSQARLSLEYRYWRDSGAFIAILRALRWHRPGHT